MTDLGPTDRLLARGTMRQSLGQGLHSVERTSYGELLFAVSVALLFWLKDGLHLSAQPVAVFEAIVLIPAYFGFAFGFLRDRWPSVFT